MDAKLKAPRLYAVQREREGLVEWYKPEWGWYSTTHAFTNDEEYATETAVQQRLYALEEIEDAASATATVVEFVPASEVEVYRRALEMACDEVAARVLGGRHDAATRMDEESQRRRDCYLAAARKEASDD